ncbi:hypothetical protein L9F63_015260, partial [Diploptera punctata]
CLLMSAVKCLLLVRKYNYIGRMSAVKCLLMSAVSKKIMSAVIRKYNYIGRMFANVCYNYIGRMFANVCC